MNDLAAAIITAYNGSTLGTLLTGGLWHGLAPAETAMPYASFTFIGQGEAEFDTGDDYNTTQHVQVDVFAETKTLAAAIAEAIKDVFDWAELTMSGGRSPVCLAVIPVGGIQPTDDDDGGGRAMFEYEIIVQRTLP